MDMVPAIAKGRDPVERSAIHWVEWNRLVRGADELLRLEDITAEDVTRLARVINPEATMLRTLEPLNGAADLIDPVTWDDIAHVDGLLELAAEYGYVPL
jgi:hypothetical protein